MAVKKTKKLSGQTSVTTINTDQKVPITDGNGKVTLISLANLKTALLAGMNLNGLYDGIFIMYHRKSDDYPLSRTSGLTYRTAARLPTVW